MYLDMMLGVLVFSSLFVSVCRCTVSNAFDMSSAMAIVRCGGLLLLNPVVIMLLMWWSAVVVECNFLKPCWWVGNCVFCVMYGSSIFSIIFAIGESRAIGLYDVPIDGSFPGFGMGMIFAVFHIAGMVFVFSDLL